MLKNVAILSCCLALSGCLQPKPEEAIKGLWVNAEGYPNNYLCITSEAWDTVSLTLTRNDREGYEHFLGSGEISEIVAGEDTATLSYVLNNAFADEDGQQFTERFELRDRETMVVDGGYIASEIATEFIWLGEDCGAYREWAEYFIEERLRNIDGR